MSTDIQKIDDAIAELCPAYSVARNGFTDTADFRRCKKTISKIS